MRPVFFAVPLVVLLACEGEKADGEAVWTGDDSAGPGRNDSGETGDSAPTGDPLDSEDTGEPAPELLTCETQPEPPYDWDQTVPIPASEDFAFGPDGYVYNIDLYGNLGRADHDGNREVILPGLGNTLGLAFVDAEHLAYNDVAVGALNLVGLDGTVTTLLGGLSSPNGVAVDLDGWVYVSEHSGDRVQRVRPDTLEAEVISGPLPTPNGISFSPDYQTVYVGSFGGGFVYALTQDDEGRWKTRVHARIPEMDDTTPCDGLAEGDDCLMPWGGVGACAIDGHGLLACNIGEVDTDACLGLADGDPCSTEARGETFESLCVVDYNEDLFCPAQEAWRLNACVGREAWEECTDEAGEAGTCTTTWEGVLACIKHADSVAAVLTCEGLSAGDACVVELPQLPQSGICEAQDDTLLCSLNPEPGAGLDGLNVDSCGNVYLSELDDAIIWQVAPDGTVAEVANLPTYYAPNLHFGLGVGGFHRNVLYVMDRAGDGLYEVYPGVEGKPEPVMAE